MFVDFLYFFWIDGVLEYSGSEEFVDIWVSKVEGCVVCVDIFDGDLVLYDSYINECWNDCRNYLCLESEVWW